MNFGPLREAIVEANLTLVDQGLVVLTWGNASAADRSAGVFGIKPSGVPYATLSAKDIVSLSLDDGSVVDGELNPSSDTPTHFELYKAFAEIGGIVHTHSTFATSWAQSCRPLQCYGTTHADHFHGEIPLARELTEAELSAYEVNTGKIIVETIIERNISPLHVPGVLVQHHGPFTWGTDAGDAAKNAVVLEEVAKMNTYTRMIDQSAPLLPNHILEKHFSRKHGPDAYYGQSKA